MKFLNIKLVNIGLQFFAEGIGDGGADGDGAADVSEVGSDDMFIAEMEQKYGITDGVASAQAHAAVTAKGDVADSQKADGEESDVGDNIENSEPSADPNEEKFKSPEEEFEELIKSDKYKSAYGQKVAKAIETRMKNQADAKAEAEQRKAEAEKYRDALSLLATKYGKNPSDVDGIIGALQSDDELLEDEALSKGKSVAELRADKRVASEKAASDRELNRLRAENQRLNAEKAARADADRWVKEAAETAKLYPDSFNFLNELKNPEFSKFLKVEGMTVTDAYEHAHMKDILSQKIKAAEDRANENAARAIQAGHNRPRESASSVNRAYNPRIDTRNMTDSEFEKIEEMLSRGERVTKDHLR